ncbi:MAG TPA: YdeI/OmpD-associated family protein, partial [Saprospiraceae bacterium]|nr:YdeI/OmpD-associated family protein [Saprospiraceae bacterium]
KDVLQKAGVGSGDTIAVQIEKDERPRDIILPEDLELLLEEEGLRNTFDALIKGRRKYLVDLVEGAKHMDTRIRRLGKCIELIHKWVAEKNKPTI